MTSRIAFGRVSIRDFRNLGAVSYEPASGVNVIVGDNGHGKTSLLEAVYAVATSRSFRTDRIVEVIAEGRRRAIVRADILEEDRRREQCIVVDGGRRSVTVDGAKPDRFVAYATRTPVVVFHPGDLALVTGPAADRRRLLDRLALFVDPTSADDRLRYTRAMRERQRTLEVRGTMAPDLEAYERLMVRHGVAFGRARGEAAARLASGLRPAFASMAPPELELDVRFRPGGTDDAAAFAEELVARRSQDQRRKTASFGPQRDELDLTLDGRSARRHASQGQQRLLTLALKASELACVRNARGAHPVLLLDDFSSELDPTRTGAVYEFLRAEDSQVFVTTTRPGLFPMPRDGALERAVWRVFSGHVVRASGDD